MRDLSTSPGDAAEGRARDDATVVSDQAEEAAGKAVRIAALIHTYRVGGTLMADTRPACVRTGGTPGDVTAFRLGEEDLDRTFVVAHPKLRSGKAPVAP
ncbi:hypothetical protein GCM10017744_000510 [Streptomyces antimycoticus]